MEYLFQGDNSSAVVWLKVSCEYFSSHASANVCLTNQVIITICSGRTMRATRGEWRNPDLIAFLCCPWDETKEFLTRRHKASLQRICWHIRPNCFFYLWSGFRIPAVSKCVVIHADVFHWPEVARYVIFSRIWNATGVRMRQSLLKGLF